MKIKKYNNRLELILHQKNNQLTMIITIIFKRNKILNNRLYLIIKKEDKEEHIQAIKANIKVIIKHL